ncbi:MAG: hypothetical protein LBJ32_04015 [Oscillospiraceae bacterium]|jgi:hypothetical protein|nr:hypothetical protein [Oscillospiraceae bacterium]
MKKNENNEKKFEELKENLRCLFLATHFNCEIEQLIYDMCRQNGLQLMGIKSNHQSIFLVFNGEEILLTF